MSDEQREIEIMATVIDNVLRHGGECPNDKHCQFCGGTFNIPCLVCKVVTALRKEGYSKASFDGQAAERIAALEKEIEENTGESGAKIAKDILQKVSDFLKRQSASVNSMSVIPTACKECYDGSQTNRHKFLKELAAEYGVVVDE